jgi:uncharacterized membrane protein YfcA
LIVGFIVGITGVGGGSLMTPFYYGLVFRQPLSELTYCMLLLLKWVVYMYIIKKNNNWVITGWLSGSVPAALLTLWILHSIKQILPL